MSDLRYALRQIAKNPGFAFIAIFALALGIGANTAIFSVINTVLLQPLPFPHSEELVRLREKTATFDFGSVSYPNWTDWRAAQKSFTDLALLRRETFNFSIGLSSAAPERLQGLRASANYLAVVGLKPVIGRDLTEADDAYGAPPAILISKRLWDERFASSPSVLGKHVLVDGIERNIIGVMPATLRFPRKVDVFLPLSELKKPDSGFLNRGNHPGFSALGRLKPSVTFAKAESDLQSIALALEKRYPDTNSERRIQAMPLFESLVGEYRQSLYILLAAVGAVLLIACANVANLQFARALARGREIAVRAALGAGRWRLARQLLVESSLLAAAGAGSGVLLTLWGLDAIVALSPPEAPRFSETHLDWRALVFTGVVAVATGILVGIWPAWRISRTASLSLALHEVGGRGSSDGASRQRMRSTLVIAQIALAVILLAAAGLALKSFWRAQNAPIGFDPHGIASMNIALPSVGYESDQKQRDFWNRLVDKVRGLPGVEAAAVGSNNPFDEGEWDSYFHVTGTPKAPPGKEPSAEMSVITPDYFRVLDLPLLRGRAFSASDKAGNPRAVIVDESFAKRYLAGRDPIGAQIDDNQTDQKDPPPLTVIGVVPRTRNDAVGESIEKFNFPQMYLCQEQNPSGSASLLLRAPRADLASLATAVRRAVASIDPNLPVAQVSTMEKDIAKSLATRRLLMVLLGVFALLALLLASVGLYGVMALTVTQRTRELGIRLALGAARENIFRLVLGHGMSMIVLGVAFGLVGALAVGRALMSLLYGVGAFDPVAVGAAIISLSAIAFVACCLPARRATLVDPIVALREE